MLKLNPQVTYSNHHYWMRNGLLQNQPRAILKTVDAPKHHYEIGFTHGAKDDFAVIITNNDQTTWCRDATYFQYLRHLDQYLGQSIVMRDIVTIFNHVHADEVDTDFLTVGLDELVRHYPVAIQAQINVLYSYLLLAATAEWNYVMPRTGRRSRLGSNVKLLGFTQVLLYHLDADTAACWSRGRHANDIQVAITKARQDLTRAGFS